MLQGKPNDAGPAVTALTSTAAATLVLANAASGAAMRVGLADDSLDPEPYTDASQSGDLINFDGALVFTHGEQFIGEVYTDAWANQVVPIPPQRLVDTRNAGGRANVINPGVLDRQGRLIAKKTMEIDLSELVFSGLAGFFNLTIVAPTAGGYATLWPSGGRPATSSINYAPGQTIANGLVCGLSEADTVRIYTDETTHVLLDVSAFWVGTPGQVNFGQDGAPALGAARAQAPRREAPSWVKSGVSRRG